MSTDFSEIAARYEQDSLVQKSAADKLLGLLAIGGNDAVLDLGCGTGNLTRKIRGMTTGRVVGVDPSEGMIREAKGNGAGLDIAHEIKVAEDIDYREEFDVIFCNSAFQWFSDPPSALKKCHNALRDGGRMGIQAPARRVYSPNFIRAVDAVASDPRTSGIFASFNSPWFFLETAREYAALSEEAGFSVPFAVIEELKTVHTPDEVMTVFESGAAAGYLNPAFFGARFDGGYAETVRRIMMDAFRAQADVRGLVELVFNRVYLLAVK